MSVVVLGYVERCEVCSGTAMLTEQTPQWVCPACSGIAPEPADELVWDRASVLIRGLFNDMQTRRKGALLDTVEALDDGDPEPGQLDREEG